MTGATCPTRGRFLTLIWPSLQIATQENAILDLLAELEGNDTWKNAVLQRVGNAVPARVEGGKLNLSYSLSFLFFFLKNFL